MEAVRGRVVGGRLVVDEPTELPEGTELLLLPTAPVATGYVAPRAEGSPAAMSAAEFKGWLGGWIRTLPSAPAIPLEALRRENLYE
jgi:hypothetical protein